MQVTEVLLGGGEMYAFPRLNFKTNHVVFSDSYHVLVKILFRQ